MTRDHVLLIPLTPSFRRPPDTDGSKVYFFRAGLLLLHKTQGGGGRKVLKEISWIGAEKQGEDISPDLNRAPQGERRKKVE